jgi:hypothetical protein
MSTTHVPEPGPEEASPKRDQAAPKSYVRCYEAPVAQHPELDAHPVGFLSAAACDGRKTARLNE